MNTRVAAVALISFCLGFLFYAGISFFWSIVIGYDGSVAYHWKRVNTYNEHINDPANYELDASGLAGTTIPLDPEPHLAALVAAYELMYADLVLPTVPVSSEANSYWMQFVGNRPNAIICAYGNSEHCALSVAGTQPIHLQIWFHQEAMSDIQQLISDLENQFGSLDE